MNTIHKYALPFKDYFALELPTGATLLTIQEQNSDLVLWALVDDTVPKVERWFRIIGTGTPITPPIGRYIATVQMSIDTFVWHVFELEEAPADRGTNALPLVLDVHGGSETPSGS